MLPSMVHGFWDTVRDEGAAREEPFFVLAPMAEVTDLPFRAVIANCGRPDVFYNEFVSAHGLCSAGRERLLKDLAIQESDHPIVAQYFGTEPEHFREVGRLSAERGFDGVDINMGCPDRKVVKQGAGISLAMDPPRARALIAAIRQGTEDAGRSLPVAVKTRLGLYRTDEMVPWLSALLEARPDVLILHGRTMKEMSKVPAHWDLIGEAARMAAEAGVLFVGNGDVTSRAQGTELAGLWGGPGIMIGRGIFQDPWLFSGEGLQGPTERIAVAREHTLRWVQHWGAPSAGSGQALKSFDLMKKFYKAYIRGWSGASALRAELMQTRTAEQALALLGADALS